MRVKLIFASMLLCYQIAAPLSAQVSVGIGLPRVSIGINLPLFPDLEPVPGFPVYYAPRVEGNFFFYDGMYWVYEDDDWYASSWYNGPWDYVSPDVVPAYVLRIPVRYYRHAPAYFRGWHHDAPPRWNEHWGRDWEQGRHGWDRAPRGALPPRPPLPVYQRKFSGSQYPRAEQQRSIHDQNYRFQPRDPVVRQQRDRAALPSLGPESNRVKRPEQRNRQDESRVKEKDKDNGRDDRKKSRDGNDDRGGDRGRGKNN